MEKVQGWRVRQLMRCTLERGWEQQDLPDWSLIRYVSDPLTKKRIFVWWACTKELTAAQHDLLEKIADILDVRLSPYAGRSPDDLSDWERDDIGQALQCYDRLIGKAVRAGLESHPLVHDWIGSCRAWGYREVLHRFWRTAPDLEKGVKRSMSLSDVCMAEAVLRLRHEGKTWEGVFRRAKAVGLLHEPEVYDDKERMAALEAVLLMIDDWQPWPDIIQEARRLSLPNWSETCRHKGWKSLREWARDKGLESDT
jgi:hypothetical protein